MKNELIGKNKGKYIGAVLITGASGGIGTACARKLDSQDFLVLAGVRKKEDGELLQRNVSKRIIPIQLDIIDEVSIKAAAMSVAKILKDFKIDGLNGLINNAGIIVEGPMELVPISSFRQQFEVNVIGQVAVTQAFLPLLRKGHGRIVNIGAVTGRTTIPFMGAISASKTAMESVTDAMRAELGLWDISVSLVEPSAMRTEIFNKAAIEGERDMNQIPQDSKARYLKILKALRSASAKQPVSEPSVVVSAIIHALTAKRPKTRYLVGKGSRLVAFLRFLPDRLRDSLLLGQLSISKGIAKDL